MHTIKAVQKRKGVSGGGSTQFWTIWCSLEQLLTL